MKKLIFGLLLLALVLPLLVSAQAPNGASVEVRQDIRDGRNAMLETRLEAIGVKMALRLTAILTRADNLISRVEAVVTRTSTNGRYDVNLAKSKLAEAKTAVEKAKTSVNGLSVKIKSAIEMSDPTELMNEVRADLRSAFNDVKTAHQKTIEVILIVRGAQTGGTN